MYTKCFTCATQSLDSELQKVLQSIDQVTYRIVDIKLSTAAYLGATVIVMYAPKTVYLLFTFCSKTSKTIEICAHTYTDGL